MFRDDYLMRQIKQLAEVLARMLKLRSEQQYDQALAAADALYEELGIPRGLHDVVDSPTLASMLRTPEAMRAAAQLQVEEGQIYRAKGDPMTAFSKYRRATELLLEARALDPQPGDDAMLLELARHAPSWMLDERYK
jgi:tetratricopeptide (TPR) repeat protein